MAEDVFLGLQKNPKKIESKYLYDENGSELFRQISLCEDYYLTKSEIEILNQQVTAPSVVNIGKDFNIIELGPGDGTKAAILLEKFINNDNKISYFAIDDSSSALTSTNKKISKISGIAESFFLKLDFLSGLEYIAKLQQNKPKLVLFFGSTIGNLTPEESQSFLLKLASSMCDVDRLLIGFDLKKSKNIMELAYNDREGLTSAFNMNLLNRLNRELGANFNYNHFYHHETYNESLDAMESYLVSKADQDVFFAQLGQSIKIKENEKIHTEYSFKYTLEEIERIGLGAGLENEHQFVDSRRYFCIASFRLKKK